MLLYSTQKNYSYQNSSFYPAIKRTSCYVPSVYWRVTKAIFFSFLQQLSDIHVTILHKEEGAGLGFSLAGGVDLENKSITVSDLQSVG